MLGREHATLISLYASDLKRVQEAFLTQRDDPPIGPNLPPIAGALYWCRSLRARVSGPIGRVKTLARDGAPVLREETKEALAAHATLAASLDDYERTKTAEWGRDVERSSAEKLRQPVLVRGGRRIEKKPRSGGGGGGGGGHDSAGGSSSGGGSAHGVSAVAAAAAGGDPRLLSVNFDAALVRLLREVKYFLFLGLPVPAPALDIYAKAETLRRQTGHLDAIASMYNSMVGEMLAVEAPLLKPQLRRVDALLAQGVRDLDWTSPHIDAFIAEAQGVVRGAYETLGQLKSNLRDIVSELEGWSREPLFGRKSKPMGPDEFEGMFKQSRSARYAAIAEGGKAIDKKLKESATVLKIGQAAAAGKPSAAGKDGMSAAASGSGTAAASLALAAAVTAHWGGYVDFVSGIVVQGLARLAAVSLRKLVDTLSPSPEKQRAGAELPLLAIDLVLEPSRGGIRFVPDIALSSSSSAAAAEGGAGADGIIPSSSSSAAADTVAGIVNGWVSSFFHAATVFPRLDDPSGRYLKDVLDDCEVQGLVAQLHDVLSRSDASCAEFRARYDGLSYLWTTDMAAAFAAFCESAYVELPKSAEQVKAEQAAAAAAGGNSSSSGSSSGTSKDAAAADAGEESTPQPRVPHLARFDAEIQRYRDLADEVTALKTPTDIGWLRVNSQPAKAALTSLVHAWGAKFTSHLMSFVTDGVTDMQAFIASTLSGLEEELETATPGNGHQSQQHDGSAAAAAASAMAALLHPEEAAAKEAAASAAQPTQAALKRCMGFIRDVRKTRYVRKSLVEPLRRAVTLLKKHGVSVDDIRIAVPPPVNARGEPVGGGGSPAVMPLVEALEGVELRLEAVINKTFARKEQIFPFQTAEMDRIKRQAACFEGTVRDFWNAFRKGAPFAFSGLPDEAYAQLDGYHAQLVAIQRQAAELNTVEEVSAAFLHIDIILFFPLHSQSSCSS